MFWCGYNKKRPLSKDRGQSSVNYSSIPNAFRRKLMKPSKILLSARYTSSITDQSIIDLLSIIMPVLLCRRCWGNLLGATYQKLRKYT